MTESMRALAWDHGCLSLQRLAGMLGPVTFLLPDGRQISPLQIAPWFADPRRETLPGVLRRLRGEWPCAPFGADAPRNLPEGWAADGETFAGADLAHGLCSHLDWDWIDAPEGALALQLDYPEPHPLSRVTRRVTPVVDAPAIDIEFTVEARRACALPLGLHPTFRAPTLPGGLRLEPALYDHVRSFPGDLEPGAAMFAPDVRFDRLEHAPRRGGGEVDATRPPFAANIEDLLQIVGIDGAMTLHYLDEGFRATLSWNPEHFPSLLLWFSNQGRKAYPWSGRHRALGVEPVVSAFDLGPAVANGRNPIRDAGFATTRAFAEGELFVTRYRIELAAA